jgi:hypothetical protein
MTYLRPKRVLIALALFTGFALPATGAYASGGPENLTVTQGSSTVGIAGAAPGSFSVALNCSNQNVVTTLATYTVTDTTGTGNGWNVTFQGSQFTCTAGTGSCPAVGGDTLPTSSLTMAVPTVACAVGTSCSGRSVAPAISIATTTALDGASPVKIASAASKTGMGTYTFTPGTLVVSGNSGALALAVPSSAYATTYNSTLTVSVGTGP